VNPGSNRRLAAKLLICLCLCAGNLAAQSSQTSYPAPRKFELGPVPNATTSATELLSSVSHADLYCAGFITRDKYSRERYVAGGLNSPDVTGFVRGDIIYLDGADYESGTRISLIRQVKDPDLMKPFPMRKLRQSFDLFSELGYADVIEMRGGIAVAKVEFSCDAILPGDLVVPFVQKAPVSVRRTTEVNFFPAQKPTLSGQVLGMQDFDQFVGTGRKIYFNLGSEQGVKPGDYFLLTRTYSRNEMDVAEALLLKSGMYDDTRVNAAPTREDSVEKLPRHVVGELVVLEVTSAGSTGMITFSKEEIHPGDTVQAE
jgi:hypothetical protein